MSQVFAYLRYTKISLLVNQIIILSYSHLYVEIWPGQKNVKKYDSPVVPHVIYHLHLHSVFSGK